VHGAAESRLAEARTWHQEHAPVLGRFAAEVRSIVARELEGDGIVVQFVSCRTKSLESFLEKSMRRKKDDPAAYKYGDPVHEITDVAGVRVVTYLQTGVVQVEQVLRRAFETQGRERRQGADDPAVPGYRGVHYLVQLPAHRRDLTENRAFQGLRAEVQVQTVLQHAWAEIQHDVLYKGGHDARSTSAGGSLRWPACWSWLTRSSGRVADDLEEALQVRADQLVEDLAPAPGELDVDRLRSLLLERLPGSESIETSRLEQVLTVLQELRMSNHGVLVGVVNRWTLKWDNLREALRRRGYEPGRVEVLDAALRVELGEEYLLRRTAYTASTPDQQAAAGRA
jgi:ppGpp synthetase/RelA/SpoT-type nucleotidyltranferase